MLLPLAVLLSVVSCSLAQSADADLYSIEHSIDSSEFREIGSFNLRAIRQSQNQAQFQGYSADGDDQRVASNLFSTPVQSDLIDEVTRSEMKAALASNNNSVYRLRLCRKSAQLQENECYAGSFIYLQQLVAAQFQINLILNTGTHSFTSLFLYFFKIILFNFLVKGATNRLSSISIRAKELSPASKASQLSLGDLEHLTLYIQVQGIRQGQLPETEAYLEKVRKELESKEKSAQGGNESFLQKYWIYIVPAVIIMFLMNLVGQDGPA